MKAWIAVDLDGTLAEYSGWQGREHIGEPIPAMVERVKAWRAKGMEVKIFTARIHNDPLSVAMIQDWSEQHLGERLEVTCVKDFGMLTLYDDRCVAVEQNSGRVLGGREI